MNHKEYATRVSNAVIELRGRRYHSFTVRANLVDIERVAAKYDVTVKKLLRYVVIRTRKPKTAIDPDNFIQD